MLLLGSRGYTGATITSGGNFFDIFTFLENDHLLFHTDFPPY